MAATTGDADEDPWHTPSQACITSPQSHPIRNLDFYTEVLGLRFVKRTINFDDLRHNRTSWARSGAARILRGSGKS